MLSILCDTVGAIAHCFLCWQWWQVQTVIDCDKKRRAFKLMLVRGDVLCATHLFFDKATAFAKRNKMMAFNRDAQ